MACRGMPAWSASGTTRPCSAKAGISAPPATWTAFLDDVKKLKAANITPIAVGEKDKWPGHFYWVYLATRIGGQGGLREGL